MTEGSEKFRLLLVDDDPEIVSAIVEALSLEFEVIGAMNGMECLEKLDLYEPDLVLLDIMMPGVDGLGACRAIRKNARRLEALDTIQTNDDGVRCLLVAHCGFHHSTTHPTDTRAD